MVLLFVRKKRNAKTKVFWSTAKTAGRPHRFVVNMSTRLAVAWCVFLFFLPLFSRLWFVVCVNPFWHIRACTAALYSAQFYRCLWCLSVFFCFCFFCDAKRNSYFEAWHLRKFALLFLDLKLPGNLFYMRCRNNHTLFAKLLVLLREAQHSVQYSSQSGRQSITVMGLNRTRRAWIEPWTLAIRKWVDECQRENPTATLLAIHRTCLCFRSSMELGFVSCDFCCYLFHFS